MRRALLWTCALAIVASMLPSAPASAAGAANLDQCANGSATNQDLTPCQSGNEWVNGNVNGSKAHYLEGQSLPYRMRMTGLTAGKHTLVIEWDTTKQGKHALDYITTYDRDVDADPCAGVSPSPCAVSDTEDIPVDGQNGTIQSPGQVFTLFGGTIDTVSGYSYPKGMGFAGDKSARISVEFTPATVNNQLITNPILAWGGHIASQADWGTGNSAISISGSPYHTRLVSLDGGGGSQDRALATSAVSAPPADSHIVIIKDAVPNDAQNFNYTTTGGLDPATFTLDDDAGAVGADATFATTKDYTVAVPAGTTASYSVTETAVSGWTPSLSCTETVTNDSTKSGTTAQIKLQPGETVTCTYVNTRQPATLIVKKHVENNDGGTKTAANFQMTVTGANASPSSFPGSETGTTVSVTPGATYTVGEVQQPGYARSDSGDCSGTVAAGQTKTCTITNDDIPLGLEVTKSANPSHLPEPGGNVEFTVNVKNTSTLPVTLNSLSDDVYGDLNGQGTCATGGQIAPGATYTCAFTGAVSGNAGTSHTDTVTAVVSDGTRTKTGQGSATVTIDGSDPVVTVDKDGPATVEEPGGVITYTIKVTNDSPASSDPITIDTIVDDKLGDLSLVDPSCGTGTVLVPGAFCQFTVTGTFTGTAGQSKTNIVKVTVHDDDGTPDEDTDDHTVLIVCTEAPGDAAGATASGNAYAAKVVVPPLGINTTLPNPIAASSQSGVGNPPNNERNVAKQSIPGVVALKLLSGESDAEITSTRATDHSEANVATVDLLAGTVVAEAVTASATANATDAGASTESFDSTIAKLTVLGIPVANVKPGTVVDVPGVGTLYVYERQNHVDPTNPNVADLTVNMLRLKVTLGPLNGTEIIVSHAEAHAKFPAAKFCGARPQGTVSGEASIAKVLTNPNLAFVNFVNAGPLPESGGSDLSRVALVGPVFLGTTKLVGAQVATAKTEGAFDGHESAAQSQAEAANVELLKAGAGTPLIAAQAVESHTSSSATAGGAGSDGSTTLVNLTINGTNVCKSLGLGTVCEPPPNTEIVSGLVLIRLNEQIEHTVGNDTEITVNAIHVFILGAGNPFGLPLHAEIIVGQSHSDACYDGTGSGACS